jgi:hypothetical protein
MLMDTGARRVYLACGCTDLRKSIDGLAALVSEAFALDPFAPCLFVFCNRQRDKIKILEWDHNGFWLLLGPLMELDNRTRYGKVWKKGVGSSPPAGEASGNRVTPPSPLA